MGLPHEGSIFCENCSCFNIQSTTCIIIEGAAYCENCIENMGLKKDFEKLKKKLEDLK